MGDVWQDGDTVSCIIMMIVLKWCSGVGCNWCDCIPGFVIYFHFESKLCMYYFEFCFWLNLYDLASFRDFKKLNTSYLHTVKNPF